MGVGQTCFSIRENSVASASIGAHCLYATDCIPHSTQVVTNPPKNPDQIDSTHLHL